MYLECITDSCGFYNREFDQNCQLIHDHRQDDFESCIERKHLDLADIKIKTDKDLKLLIKYLKDHKIQKIPMLVLSNILLYVTDLQSVINDLTLVLGLKLSKYSFNETDDIKMSDLNNYACKLIDKPKDIEELKQYLER